MFNFYNLQISPLVRNMISCSSFFNGLRVYSLIDSYMITLFTFVDRHGKVFVEKHPAREIHVKR
jgi:hypothetical protein